MKTTAWAIRAVVWTAAAAALVGASAAAERLVPGRWGEVALCGAAAVLAAGGLLVPELILEALRPRARDEGHAVATRWGDRPAGPRLACDGPLDNGGRLEIACQMLHECEQDCRLRAGAGVGPEERSMLSDLLGSITDHVRGVCDAAGLPCEELNHSETRRG